MSATTDVLHVELRDKIGSLAARKLRRSGRIPAILYGHGEGTQHLTIAASEVSSLLRHHGKAVTLDGAVKDTALLSDVQFNALGTEVLHLDLIRVNLQEKVVVTVPVHLSGDAVGVRSGGVLLENVHEVEVRCSAGSIPESLTLNVGDLDVGGHKTAGDIVMPEGVELVTAKETVVAHVEKLRGAKEDAPAAEADAAKPGDK